MTGRFTITYHPEAGNDLDIIDEFIASYAGEVIAEKIINEIRAKISKLTDFPHIGTVRNEVVAGLRALAAAEKATLCFTVNDESRTVKIVCVAYAGQDWQTIARSREAQP